MLHKTSSFVRLSILTVVLSLFAPILRADETAKPAAPPNIVVFLADDLGWADCTINGAKDVPMPNLDRLAAAGMTFSQAFVASPSCAPSRAALLTGLDPMRNGAMLNHAHTRNEIKRWPAYFQKLGYEVAAIGKVAHYAQVKEYGFDHFSHFTYHEDDCIEAAAAWLQARTSTKPLCLLVGTNWPHVPWPKNPLGDPAKVMLPPKTVDTDLTRLARAKYHAALANMDRDLGIVLDKTREKLGDDTLIVFTGDHGAQFPFGKWNLYDTGVRTPLIVSWPGKIAPRSTSTAMVGWVDLLPTLLEAAGDAPPNDLSGKSFLGVLNGTTKQHRDRVFLTHSGDGKMNMYPQRAVRTARYKLIRNLDPTIEHHTHIDKAPGDGPKYWDTWVEKAKQDPAAAKLVDRYLRRPAEEFYDLKTDPHEERNLIDDPASQQTIGELRVLLDAWMKEQGDQGLATEKTLTLNPPGKQATKTLP
ncbi:MAG: sulfatase [Pirellulales bacterium]